MSPSASDWSVRSVLKTGAWFVLVTVQVNVSVSVSGPSLTVMVTLCVPAELLERVPLITPVAVLMREAAGQARGAVRQRVEVGVGRVGIEADRVALGVGLVGDVGLKTGAWFAFDDRPGERVGIADGAVDDGDGHVVRARRCVFEACPR